MAYEKFGLLLDRSRELCFGAGAISIFINFVAIRQAVTPTHLLGRMTSTMRWLILTPAVPGALLGGWLGETVGLRAALLFAALGGLALTAVAWRLPRIWAIRALPVYREPAPAAA